MRYNTLILACMAALIAGCASTPKTSSSATTGSNKTQSAPTGSKAVQQQFAQALTDIKAGNLEKAERNLQALVAAQPDLAAAQNNLGVVYRQRGEFSKAESAYKAALAADSENANAHINLGILYDIYLAQPAQALTHYERYQALSKESDKEVALWIAELKQRL